MTRPWRITRPILSTRFDASRVERSFGDIGVLALPRGVVPVVASVLVLAVTLGIGVLRSDHSDDPKSSQSKGLSTPSNTAPHPLTEAQIEKLLLGLPHASTTFPANSTGADPTEPVSGTAARSPSGTATPTTAANAAPPSTSLSSGSSGDMDGVPSYKVGQTGTLWDPANEVPLATIAVSAPTFTTTDSSGDAAQYGYFAVFTVTVTNIAPASSDDTIAPSDSDYYVRANGGDYGLGQANIGNTNEADKDTEYLGYDLGGGNLNPGRSTTGTVTVDVPSQHGSIVYAPSGSDVGTWSY